MESPTVYRVLKRLENDEFVQVAIRENLEQAILAAKLLNEEWPGEYLVRDSEGSDLKVSG